MSKPNDRWTSGSTYEEFMGRWSRRLAPAFLAWLGIPPGTHWLDVGCGTGALTTAICEHAAPASVVGCDPAEPFVTHARAQNRNPNVSFVVAGSGSLPARDGGYDSITSLIALNFFPDPKAGVAEMRDRTAAGGTVSACVWDYAGRMQMLRFFWDAVVKLDATAEALDEGRRFPVCDRDVLMDLFQSAGLDEVRCEPVEIITTFASFEDYWRPFTAGTGPAPSYVASLDADRRHGLEQELRTALSPNPDGSISLIARAWAVRGNA